MSMIAEIRCPLALTVPNHGQKHRLDCDRRAESINRLGAVAGTGRNGFSDRPTLTL